MGAKAFPLAPWLKCRPVVPLTVLRRIVLTRLIGLVRESSAPAVALELAAETATIDGANEDKPGRRVKGQNRASHLWVTPPRSVMSNLRNYPARVRAILGNANPGVASRLATITPLWAGRGPRRRSGSGEQNNSQPRITTQQRRST